MLARANTATISPKDSSASPTCFALNLTVAACVWARSASWRLPTLSNSSRSPFKIEIASSNRSSADACQFAFKRDPLFASKRDPLRGGEVGLTHVVHRRDPSATRSAPTSGVAARVGGSCAPSWRTPGGGLGEGLVVNRRAKLTPDRRPILTPAGDGRSGSSR